MKEWLTDLPEDMQGNETLNRFNSVEDLAKSYIEARSSIGSMMRVPSEDASDEDRAQFVTDLINKVPNVMLKPDFDEPEQSKDFFKTLGVPDTATDYTNPEDIEMSPEMESDLRDAAFELNMTPQQYKQFATRISKQFNDQVTKQKETAEAGINALKGKWGAAYDANRAAAEKIFNENKVGDQTFDALNAEGIETFFQLSKQLTGKGPQVGDQPDNIVSVMSPDEAQNQINDIFRNNKHPYFDPAHPDHQRALRRMLDLQDYAHGRKPPEDGRRPTLAQIAGR